MPKMHHKRRDEIEAELEQLNKDYSELEFKLSCILDRVTGGCISKPHTDVSLINEAIHRQVLKEWKYAIADYKETHSEPTLENTVCNWKRDLHCESNGVNVYETECGNTFEVGNDDTPEENGFKFCSYCGGELKYAILFSDEIDKLMEY